VVLQVSYITVLGTEDDLERNHLGDGRLLVQSISSTFFIIRLGKFWLGIAVDSIIYVLDIPGKIAQDFLVEGEGVSVPGKPKDTQPSSIFR
jgi:hypothetical protein